MLRGRWYIVRCFYTIFFIFIIHNLGMCEVIQKKTTPSHHEHSHALPPLTLKGLTLIITGLGLDTDYTEKAMYELPKAVVLSFSNYTKMISQRALPARDAGHEILLELGSEEDIEQINVLSYFDGVLLLPYLNPFNTVRSIENFIHYVKDKKKYVVEGRLFSYTLLKEKAMEMHYRIYPVSLALYTFDVFSDDTHDVFKKPGIVMCPAFFVPFLIDYFQSNPKNAQNLVPLSSYSQKL